MTHTQLVGMLAAIFLFIAIYLVFSFAEIEMTMLEVQKIFYFHISAAFTLFLAFGVTFISSILYLIKRRDKYDTIALVSTEIGIIFGVVVFTTGPIWARFAWNTWWNWEPRLTSALILWLTYIGYLILRSALAEEKKRVYSAVLGTIGFLKCAHRLLFGRALARWFTSGHQHQDEPAPNHANSVVDFMACADPSLPILADVPISR